MAVAGDSAYTVGNLRGCLALDLQNSINDIIEEKANEEKVYYIIVRATREPGGVRTKIILSPVCLHPEISVMQWRVDNKAGTVEPLYALPPDAPVPDEAFDENAKPNEFIAKCIGKTPLVY